MKKILIMLLIIISVLGLSTCFASIDLTFDEIFNGYMCKDKTITLDKISTSNQPYIDALSKFNEFCSIYDNFMIVTDANNYVNVYFGNGNFYYHSKNGTIYNFTCENLANDLSVNNSKYAYFRFNTTSSINYITINYSTMTNANADGTPDFYPDKTARCLKGFYSNSSCTEFYNDTWALPYVTKVNSTISMDKTEYTNLEDIILTITNNSDNEDIKIQIDNGSFESINGVQPNKFAQYYDSITDSWNIDLMKEFNLNAGVHTITLIQNMNIIDTLEFEIIGKASFTYIDDIYQPFAFSSDSISIFLKNGAIYSEPLVFKLEEWQNNENVNITTIDNIIEDDNFILIYLSYSICKPSLISEYRITALDQEGNLIAESNFFKHIPSAYIPGIVEPPPPHDIEIDINTDEETGDTTIIVEDITRDEQTDSINGTIEESTKGIIGTILSIPEMILNGIKSLFIPDEEFFENYWNDLNEYMKSKLGFLWEVVLFIPNLFGNIIEVCDNFDGSMIFEIPTISVPLYGKDFVILEGFDYNVGTYLDENPSIDNLYSIYLDMIDFFVMWQLVKYALFVIQDIFKISVNGVDVNDS